MRARAIWSCSISQPPTSASSGCRSAAGHRGATQRSNRLIDITIADGMTSPSIPKPIANRPHESQFLVPDRRLMGLLVAVPYSLDN